MLKKIKTNNTVKRTIVLESKENPCEKCRDTGEHYSDVYYRYPHPKLK